MCLRFLILLVLAAFAAPLGAAPAETTSSVPEKSTNAISARLPEEMDKVSYSFGMSVANSFKPVPDFRTNAFLAGFFDVLHDNKTVLTETERDDILKKFDQFMQVRRNNELSAKADQNKTDGENFLAANTKTDGIITLPSGLQYKVVTTGTGPMPKASDTVTIHYRGTFVDGHEFDSSYRRKIPNTVPLTQVIKGWAEALQLMPVGSKWQVFVPSELGYGRNNNIKEIPPNSTLIYEIELLSIAGTPAVTSTK